MRPGPEPVYFIVFHHRDALNRPAPPVQHLVPQSRTSAAPYWAACGRILRVSAALLCPLPDPAVPICAACLKTAGRPERSRAERVADVSR
jgi:hypothetical protein